MRNRRLVKVAGILVGLTMLAAACGDDDDGDAGGDGGDGGGEVQEFSIAFVGPLTGSAANLGIYIRDGARVAIEEFNEEHGDEF